MAQTIGQHNLAAFTYPINGQTPIDANTVRGNDNTIRTSYNDHDSDAGIHLQSSPIASRPMPGTTGRKWLTTDSSSYRLFFDDGSSWYELSYLSSAGGTVSGNLSVTGTLGVTGAATFGNSITLNGRTYTFPATETANYFLKTNGSGTLTWGTLAETIALTDLSDVTITSATSGQPLVFNGTSWVNASAITAAVTGNASTATALQTARTINGVSFDGTANITVTAAAGTLTGSTLASGVTASSLTSVGTLTSLTTSGSITYNNGTLGTAANTPYGSNNSALYSTVNIGLAGSYSSFNLPTTSAALSTTAWWMLGRSNGTDDQFSLRVRRGGTNAADQSAYVVVTSGADASKIVDSHQWHTNSAQRMALDSNGNLGIGTSSPSYKLHVENASANVDAFIGQSSTRGLFWQWRYNATAASAYGEISTYGGNNPLYIQTQTGSGNTIMNFNGNVGIGTSSPAQKLEVFNAGDVYMRLTGNIASGNVAGVQFFRNGGSVVNAQISAVTEIANDYGVLRFATAGVSGLAERARIDSSGNLGLGVTPTAWWTGARVAQVGLGTVVEGRTGTNIAGFGANYYIDSGGGTSYINTGTATRYQQNATGDHVWQVAPSGTGGTGCSFTQAMTLNASGNLGIGASSPDSNITILSGTSSSNGINIKRSGWNSVFRMGAQGANGDDFWITNNYNPQTGTYDSVENGYINLAARNAVKVYTSNTARWQIDASGHLSAVTDASYDIGASGANRPRNLYISGSAYTGNISAGNIFVPTTSGIFFSSGIGDYANGIYGVGTNNVAISSAGSERARITSSGRFYVGATSGPAADPVSYFYGSAIPVVYAKNAGAGGYTFNSDAASNGGTYYHFQFLDAGTSHGSISSNGTNTAYNTTSDVRLKKNITDADAAGAVIDAIAIRQFDWKSNDRHQRYGVIAQEVESVFPEMITKGQTEDDMWGVDFSTLVPVLVKEIQSLRSRVAALEA